MLQPEHDVSAAALSRGSTRSSSASPAAPSSSLRPKSAGGEGHRRACRERQPRRRVTPLHRRSREWRCGRGRSLRQSRRPPACAAGGASEDPLSRPPLKLAIAGLSVSPGSDTTHCRYGTFGITRSTKYMERAAIRLPEQLEQIGLLQEKGTMRGAAHRSHRYLKKPQLRSAQDRTARRPSARTTKVASCSTNAGSGLAPSSDSVAVKKRSRCFSRSCTMTESAGP